MSYDPELAVTCATLWNELAYFEGEDADAQLIIERAFIAHFDDIIAAKDAEIARLLELLANANSALAALHESTKGKS